MYYRLKPIKTTTYYYKNYNSKSLHELIARDGYVHKMYEYHTKKKIKFYINEIIEENNIYKIEKSIKKFKEFK